MGGTTFSFGYKSSDVDQGGFFVQASVAGSAPHTFQLDSGSCGMIIGQNYLPSNLNLNDYPCFGPGQMHYLPSNNIRSGTWYFLPISLIDTPSGKTIDSNCMVLVINDPADFGGGMMGVAAQASYPAYNALLNAYVTVDDQKQPLTQSFVLTQQAAIIGADHTDLGFPGFHYVQLVTPTELPLEPAQTNQVPMNWQSSPIWSPPQTTLTLKGSGEAQPASASANFMMDTGINQMLMVAPDSFIPANALESGTGQRQFVPNIGTQIGIELLGLGGAQLLSYTFTVDSPAATTPPETPADVVYLGQSTNAADPYKVNVGIHPLRSHLYMYDYAAGLIGFAPIA
ncbi:hypothetical protein [Niveispirillum sp. KHB5.9]|uniref:hypothetical protein n=1 Tax=Niveispirillum sp. KHB5.9 TaxID=3400269 RepID=UPI003A83685F